MQQRTHIGFFGVLALVLLRLATGWHFFDQGLDKFDPGFSSEGLIRSAKGPLAPEFQKLIQGVHGVDTLLFVPREYDADSSEKPYTAWLEQITSAWEKYSEKAAKLTEGDAAEACQAVFEEWRKKLASYLATQSEAIAEHQNELYRLEQLRQKAPAGSLPFNDERVDKKAGETFYNSRQWVADVRSLEANYRTALIETASEAGADKNDVAAAVEPTTTLDLVNQIVKYSVIGIGICLLLGFWTRLAAVGGALFLCSVIATQPPWVYGANTQYFWYQLVEVSGLLTLAVFGAGQWLGVDAVFKGLRKVN